jgi:hypothetical protein
MINVGTQVYTKKNFAIIDMDEGYIVINKDKEFKQGHTHITNFNTAKYLIDMVLYSRMPYHLPIYLLISLQRLSTDENYRDKIGELIKNKRDKENKYVNRSR